MSHCIARAPLSSVRLCLAALSLMAALLLLSSAAFAQTHGTYTVQYSGGSVGVTRGTAFPFHAGNGPDASDYRGSGEASGYTDTSGNSQTCSVSIPDLNNPAPSALTATFTWHPDPSNPNEPPPSAALVLQTCQASWSASPSGGAVCTGDVDNGLGAAVISVSNGQGASSSKYTGWAAPDPAHPPLSFPVSCNPSAHFSGSSGAAALAVARGSASVTYTATATPIFVDLRGITLVSGMPEALTGQQITATLNGVPAGVKMTSYTWSFDSGVVDKPAKPIKNWDETASGDSTHPQLVPLTAADLMGIDTTGNGISVNPINFYDEVGENVTVKCAVSLKFPDGTTATVNAQSLPVAFLKPNVSKWMIDTGYIQPTGSPDHFGLMAAPGTGFPGGENWHDVTIDVPQPFSGGEGCLAQLITPGFEMYRDGAPGPAADPNDKKQGLDNSFPYTKWDLPALGKESDRPQAGVAGVNVPQYQGWNTATVNDDFVTWVMYKPPAVGTQGHIWVPLKNYSWSLSYTLQWLNDQWTMTASDPSATMRASPRSPAKVDSPPSWSLIQTNGH